jgi:hypothetical protein
MACVVEIISYPEPSVTIVTQGEFDETIATFGETNIVVICPDTGEIPVIPE